MPENGADLTGKEFKEAVSLLGQRIYDSCSEQDCLEDLRVYFTSANQNLIDQAVSIKTKGAEVAAVFFDVEPVSFHPGFYAVDLTYYFRVCLEAYPPSPGIPTLAYGFSSCLKKVILFGSEGKVRTFDSASQGTSRELLDQARDMPKAGAQVADPMVLSSRVTASPPPGGDPPFQLPPSLEGLAGGSFQGVAGAKRVSVTLGLFSLVWLERSVPLLVPSYEFCLPEECAQSYGEENPGEQFKKMKFPTSAFFPPRIYGEEEEA